MSARNDVLKLLKRASKSSFNSYQVNIIRLEVLTGTTTVILSLEMGTAELGLLHV